MEQPVLSSQATKPRVRLLFLNQWFDPEPCMKGLLFTEALTQRDIDVTVITGTPNYPTGNVYPGYKLRWHERRQMGSTKVHIVALYPSHDGNSIKRILNYVSFFFTGIIRMLLLARRADVLYAYHPPLTVPLAAVLVGKLTRRRCIVEVQDLWPESLGATGMADSQFIVRIVGALAGFVYRNADVVIAQSEGFRTAIIDRGAKPDRVHVVYNWANEAAPDDQTESEPSAPKLRRPGADEFHLLYAGNLGPAQDLPTLLTAAELLQEQNAAVRIHLMGSGQSEAALKSQTEDRDLRNVTFHPLQPRNQVGAALAQADALLVILKDDPLFAITVPSKTQSSLASGRPIVMAVTGEAATLVTEAGAGVTVAPGNPEALANTISNLANIPDDLREHMGNAGRKYYLEHLSLDAGAEATATLIRSAARS
jgi:colanic acid biosynthesis glycosyl transferase WcaI